MPSIFLSFLGTNRYIPCNYSYEEKETVSNVYFIQEALIRMFCHDFGPDDKICIFLTSEARRRNWEPTAIPEPPVSLSFRQKVFFFFRRKQKASPPYEGLKNRLASLTLQAPVCTVDIPDGLNEQDIWSIFRALYTQVPDNAHIYLDITHAFRSIPMLASILLNYLYVVKNVTVKGIYYGAFETLGSVRQAENIPLSRRTAPVINLLPFYELHRWTNAAHAFITYGQSRELEKMVRENVWQRKDESLKTLNVFAENLKKVSSMITLLRGKEIYTGTDFAHMKKLIETLQKEKGLEPLSPLFSTIQKKIEPFAENDFNNCLHAISWCIDHSLMQQAITLMDEAVITFICLQFKDKHNLSYDNLKSRKSVTLAFEILAQPNKKKLQDDPIAMELSQEPLLKRFRETRRGLHELRNSINHAGFTDNKKADQFSDALKNIFEKLKTICHENIDDAGQ